MIDEAMNCKGAELGTGIIEELSSHLATENRKAMETLNQRRSRAGHNSKRSLVQNCCVILVGDFIRLNEGDSIRL
jgi:hypothetical protein